MTFKELAEKWQALVDARKDHARLAEHGRGSDCEAAGMNLFEADRDFRIAFQSAPVDVQQQLETHRVKQTATN